MNSKNDYEVYRMTSLGVALEETIDDMIQVFFFCYELLCLLSKILLTVICLKEWLT
jgi:hypothetical protein